MPPTYVRASIMLCRSMPLVVCPAIDLSVLGVRLKPGHMVLLDCCKPRQNHHMPPTYVRSAIMLCSSMPLVVCPASDLTVSGVRLKSASGHMVLLDRCQPRHGQTCRQHT